MYHPVLGEFLSRDPLPDSRPVLLGGGGATHRELANLYAYVSNNPTNLTDPSGLKGGPECLQKGRRPTVGTPPPFPGPGGAPNGGDNSGSLLGWNFCLFTPPTRPSRVKPIPGLRPPSGAPPMGPSRGKHAFYPPPVPGGGMIGTGGADPCVALIVKCKGGVAVFHFQVGDDPCQTLASAARWDGCEAIVCGGASPTSPDSSYSDCLAYQVILCAGSVGINLVGVSAGTACGVNPDGTWYDNTLAVPPGRPAAPASMPE